MFKFSAVAAAVALSVASLSAVAAQEINLPSGYTAGTVGNGILNVWDAEGNKTMHVVQEGASVNFVVDGKEYTTNVGAISSDKEFSTANGIVNDFYESNSSVDTPELDRPMAGGSNELPDFNTPVGGITPPVDGGAGVRPEVGVDRPDVDIDGIVPNPDFGHGNRPETGVDRPDVPNVLPGFGDLVGGLGDTATPEMPNGGGIDRPDLGEGEKPVAPERPEALPEVDEDFGHNGSDIERPMPEGSNELPAWGDKDKEDALLGDAITGAYDKVNANSAAINAVNNRIAGIEQDIDELKGGVAMSFAMSALPQAYRPHSTNIGVAGGYYNGANAIAVGVSHNFDSLTVNLKASTTGEDTGFAVGVGYSF